MNSKSAVAYLLIPVLGALTQNAAAPPRNADAGAARKNAAAEPVELRELRTKGNALFNSGKYIRAAAIYESGYRAALAREQFRPAIRFLNNLGSAHYVLFQYRKALNAYLDARSVAVQAGDFEMLGAISFNLSSLYLLMGNVDAAAESAQKGLEALRGGSNQFKSRLLIQLARVKHEQHDTPAAVSLLRDAVETSRQRLDTPGEAQAWNELGEISLDLRHPGRAAKPLLEAYRLRKLTRDNRLYFSYENLGKLRMQQEDPRSAAELFSASIEAARQVSPPALWSGYYERGQAELAQGLLEKAFADFTAALNWLRRWRAEVLPADAFRISSEVQLHEVFSAYIDLAARLYRQTGNPRFAEQAFAAAEEARSASLRAITTDSGDLTKRLPQDYWEALSRLHAAESALAVDETSAASPEIRELRLKLAEMETHAGLDLPDLLNDSTWTSGRVLEGTRRALGPDAVYLGFSLGASESWLWIVAREGFEMRRLPRAASIDKMAGEFVHAVSSGSPKTALLGRELYRQLLEGARPHLIEKPVWILGLEGSLFEVPFAALVQADSQGNGLPRYVIEDHAVQAIPGVWSLLRGGSPAIRGPFVGLGDPIYNSADPRGSKSLAADAPKTEFARLAGSQRELDQCAAVWRSSGSQVVLLEGVNASRMNLLEALRRGPSVVHLAVHMIFPGGAPDSGLLALSMQPRVGVEFLSAADIAGMRAGLGLVVLNGCSSAHAAILPGAGLMGMTRAWLAAGARAVIATRWPTADDNTELFSNFYRSLNPARAAQPYSFARALREAQLSQLRAGGLHSGPAFWGAYVCVGRN